jgi:hypothetical protein
MKIRITYYGALGTIYSEISESYPDYPIRLGDWSQPFPNEKGNSTAFGLVECMLQSGYNPFKEEEEIERIKVEKL